jgi:hypothetical protein
MTNQICSERFLTASLIKLSRKEESTIIQLRLEAEVVKSQHLEGRGCPQYTRLSTIRQQYTKITYKKLRNRRVPQVNGQ